MQRAIHESTVPVHEISNVVIECVGALNYFFDVKLPISKKVLLETTLLEDLLDLL